MNKEELMQKAIDIANENVLSGHGGPFAAIIVKDGEIIGIGKNEVTTNNDPTAHAEVQAIREACKNLNSFQLSDCEIYTSCEPCPMCIGAIYWARPKAVYYALTKEDAAKIGFDDKFIYEEIALPINQRRMQMKKMDVSNNNPFETWEKSQNKVEY